MPRRRPGGAEIDASPSTKPRLEAESQTGCELQVVARLAVLKLAAQALERRDVVACLETETDAAVRLVQVEADGAVAERVGLGACAGNVAQVVRPRAAAEDGIGT